MNAKSQKDRTAWLQGPAGKCDDDFTGERPWRLVLLGAPGVGKGTQADLLGRRLGTCHLSTGDIFRAAVSCNGGEQTRAIREALGYMNRGCLVPDTIVWEMVRERMECLRCAGGFILDGFPRTLGQAESLKHLLDREEIELDAVVNFELPSAEIVARLGGRRTCEKCKGVFHLTERPPKVANRCDRCGGKLFQRDDDRPETIAVRLETYEHSTAPLIEFYKNLGLLISVFAKGSPEGICEKTSGELRMRRNQQGDPAGVP